MNQLLQNSVFFGVMLSILSYELGVVLKKKYKWAILNPLLIAVAVIIIILIATHVDYKSYYAGAKYLSYLLTPATVCLAIPLYEQFEVLKAHWKAVIVGIFAGVLTSLCSISVMCLIFGLTHKQFVTLLPKSITIAIGIGVSEGLGGYVTITVATIMITGILGNIIAELVCKVFRIEEAVAKGVAIGTASHAVGTAKAMEMGEVEGAMSSLSIGVAGLITVVFAPLFSYIM